MRVGIKFTRNSESACDDACSTRQQNLVTTDWGTENRRNSALGRLPATWLKIHYSGADGENVDIDAAVRIIYSISTAPRVYPVYIGVER